MAEVYRPNEIRVKKRPVRAKEVLIVPAVRRDS
jgi:hypothetical protein